MLDGLCSSLHTSQNSPRKHLSRARFLVLLAYGVLACTCYAVPCRSMCLKIKGPTLIKTFKKGFEWVLCLMPVSMLAQHAAIQCLKKKKLYEAQLEQVGNFQLRVHDQMILLEGAKATTDTIEALRTGSSAVKSIQQSLSIDDIEKTMEQANEHTENMRQIQEALAMPVGAAADFDEDELEAELEDLEGEELEEELLQPPSTVPAAPLPNPNQPERQTPRPASDVDELAALQAEMAL